MDFKAVCVLNLVFLFISVHCTFYIGPLTFPFPSLASLLSCQPSTHYRPEPCRPTRSRGLGDCEPSSISFGILLFFFRFIPEGLSESVMTTKQQIWEILPGGEKGQMYPDVEPKTMSATAGQVTDSEAGDPSRRVQTWASRNSDCTWFTSDFLDYFSSTFHPPRERLNFASNDRPPG